MKEIIHKLKKSLLCTKEKENWKIKSIENDDVFIQQNVNDLSINSYFRDYSKQYEDVHLYSKPVDDDS